MKKKPEEKGKKAPFSERIRSYFTQQPQFTVAFQLTSCYFSGMRVSSKDKSVKHHFLFPLERGIVEPSFSKPNLKKPEALAEKIEQGLRELGFSGQSAVLLLPEMSQKTFIFAFDSFPPSPAERTELISFRIKKQMLLLPDDLRLSFDIIRQNGQERVVAAVARSSIIKEYENLFGAHRIRLRAVRVPFLSLVHLLPGEEGKDCLLVNLEDDSFSLVAIDDRAPSLYRQKSFEGEPQKGKRLGEEVDNIAQEIENTVHFIEDREKRSIASVWVRVGLLEPGEEVFLKLKERIKIPVRGVDSSLSLHLPSPEKRMLAPLIGQLL